MLIEYPLFESCGDAVVGRCYAIWDTFSISMALLLAWWLFTVVNYLSRFVVCDLLKISIVIAVNKSLQMNDLVQASRVVGYGHLLEVRFLAPSAFGF